MGKIQLRCGACQYKFSRAETPKMCPFCGKPNVEEDHNQSAADILQEVSEMDRSIGGR